MGRKWCVSHALSKLSAGRIKGDWGLSPSGSRKAGGPNKRRQNHWGEGIFDFIELLCPIDVWGTCHYDRDFELCLGIDGKEKSRWNPAVGWTLPEDVVRVKAMLAKGQVWPTAEAEWVRFPHYIHL